MIPRVEGPARIPAARNMIINGWRKFCPIIPMKVARPRMAANSTNVLPEIMYYSSPV